jgi:hypothetical protein
MRAGRGTRSTTTIAAACLAASLWVAGCTAAGTPQGTGPLPTVSVPSPSPAATPAPAASTPAVPDPVGSAPVDSAPSVSVPGAAPSATGPGVSAPGTPSVAVPAAPPSPVPASSGGSVQSATEPGPAVEPSPQPGTSAPEPASTATVIPVDASGPAVYYVAIDDGGSRGVRFGCNDSLVPVRGVAVPGDPLSVALGRLLGAGMPLDSDAALYDALASSSLRYLSGYMNGSTVVVNLSGSLRPGGVCDIPRIQAQLTHTIVSASGATRAEIYVNGRTLTEALSVR